MPIVRPRKLSPRGIVSHLLPHYFRKPQHPQQQLPGDAKSIQVPWDANELYEYIIRKEKKFRSGVKGMYETGIRLDGPRPHDASWCLATGGFRPRPQIVATQIFPLALGSNIIEFISGTRELWFPTNSLMLPKPAKEALDALALTVVPEAPEHMLDRGIRDYKFCVMDSEHSAMSKALFKAQPGFDPPQITTGQLDRAKLNFGNAYRPRDIYLYFQSCCAVWKKTYLDDPKCDDEADFAARFFGEISQYWHPDYVKASKVTDVFLFKCKDARLPPPPQKQIKVIEKGDRQKTYSMRRPSWRGPVPRYTILPRPFGEPIKPWEPRSPDS